MLERQKSTDQNLVRRTLEGDREAYSALVQRYLQVIHAVLYARTGNHSDAEDLAQDAFLKAFQSLDTLRKPARFAPWLITIARNQSISLQRKQIRAENFKRHIETPKSVPPEDPAKHEIHGVLRQQIMALPQDSREALLLHYFAGKTHREIATLLGLSKAGVQKRIARAREVLSKNFIKTIGADFLSDQSKICRQKTILALIASSSVTWNPTAHAVTLKTITTLGGILAMKKFAAIGAGAYRPADCGGCAE